MSSPQLPDPDAATVRTVARASRPPISAAVHRIAAALAARGIGAGDAADLRRLAPGDPSSPAFWKVMAEYVAPTWPLPAGGALLDAEEWRWAVVLNALAHLIGLDAPGRPLGAALATSGLSELRFVRLLRARDDRLADAVRSTARFLASKAEPANLADLADLVMSDGRGHAESVRRRLARSYYHPVLTS